MPLRDCSLNPEYRSGEDDLIHDFYHPLLAQANEYWRAVGFFRSSALEAIGAPLGAFVASGGRIRLVTSVDLSDEDIRAIEDGLDRQTVCEQRLLEQIRNEFAEPFGRGAMLLARLLEVGRLEIKVALPRNLRGIYHEKVGLFLDGTEDYVAFSGSPNESRQGLETNYECIDVYTSWDDPTRASRKRDHFNRLWEGTARGATTLDFPEAARRELIRRANRFRTPSSFTPTNEATNNRWRHQDEAVDIFLVNRRGVLEMATGTGKTRTALRICTRLLDDRAIDTIIVTTDGNDLLDQWHGQLMEVGRRTNPRMPVLRQYDTHHERDLFLVHPQNSVLLISRGALASVLSRLPASIRTRTLLIHDEVHGLGSAKNQADLEGLSDDIPYRLGLSATPDREYDDVGNVFIERHIGPKLMSFGIEDAIRRGILVPFDYFPIEYTPDDDDKRQIARIRARFEALKNTATPMSEEQLFIELARVHKTSRAKLPLFDDFIAGRVDLLQRCIVFVETMEYGAEVLPLIHKYRYDFHTYYGGDDPAILKRFAVGEVECLLTCHRISEGIDIRSVETVILFSSSRARLETIQRIGRCLRWNPDVPNKRANVVDFIRINPDDPNEDNSDQARRTWLDGVAQISYEEEI